MPPTRLRIVHVAETVRGGIATYFNELHPLQSAEVGEDNVHYVIPADHRADLIGVDDRNISTFERTGRNVPSLWRMAAQTVGAVKRLSPDVVHLHSSFAGLVMRPLHRALRHRVRVVYCPHGWSFARETSALSRSVAQRTERLLSPLADDIVCISQNELDNALRAGVGGGRLRLVRSGLNPGRTKDGIASHGWTDDRVRVLFVGRLDRQKGYDVLVEAARRLVDKISVRMIGSAVVGEEREIDLPPNVELLGWQDRPVIDAQLDLADVAVVPSRWEGFGLVGLEAMRASKPVIASRAGALPEIVEDGLTGYLCAPDDPTALADVLGRCDRGTLAELGRRGRERLLSHFSIEKTHRELMAIYAAGASPALRGNAILQGRPGRDFSVNL